MEINKIYCESNLETMKRMPDNFIDLVVTSPPYDNLRDYNGYSFNFETIAKELYRVTKKGGVVVWIVGDATIKGSETGTSFRQALYFMECGFNLHDTMIWNKGCFSAVGALKTRYAPVFEYMFVFSKNKLNTFNAIKDKKNKVKGKIQGNIRQKDGSLKKMSSNGKLRNEYGQRFSIWEITPCGGNKSGHPAPFPEQLAHDHIISWSNENDLVYDPFMGSGTTAKMAILNNRNWLGSEISKEYVDIINKRISNVTNQTKLF
jgi:site-specific DNA-methyltransferase (adenine-specific)